MSTIMVVGNTRRFFAEPDSIKVETRKRAAGTCEVVSAAGSWSPDGIIEWMSWPADRAEFRGDPIERTEPSAPSRFQ